MQEIHGNTEGIRQSNLAQLRTLYDYPFEADEFLPADLARILAKFSSAFNREIAVYVSRDGDVLDIVIGERDNVTLPSLRLRRSEKRLSRVRVIHTHPRASAELSDVDLTALRSLWLDAICAVGTDMEGNVTGISCAFLGEKQAGIPVPMLTPLLPLSRLPQSAWMHQIDVSDTLVMQGEQRQEDAPERALLVSIDSDASLDELTLLAESAGAIVVGRELQHKEKPDPATYIGSGKAAQLLLTAQALEADLLIVDDELTGAQTRNLEDIVQMKVVDRTTLILDIFAQRARSGEGKLQVALAQLQYQQSRLIGQGLVLSRLAGGIGTRGPGESKLEMDRRRIRTRMVELTKQLDEMEKQRALRRKMREKNAIPQVALVGYTNTGKSTLLNRMTDADVYVQDQLFATLDAVSRKVEVQNGTAYLLTDTVGFISKLPTDLIAAFKSTLEEASRADVLVIVSDASSEDAFEQHQIVEKVLADLGADTQPRIDVLNKCDKGVSMSARAIPGAIEISARTGDGIPALLKEIQKKLAAQVISMTVFVPFSAYQMMNDLRGMGRVQSEEYQDSGTMVTVLLPPEAIGRLQAKWGALLPK